MSFKIIAVTAAVAVGLGYWLGNTPMPAQWELPKTEPTSELRRFPMPEPLVVAAPSVEKPVPVRPSQRVYVTTRRVWPGKHSTPADMASDGIDVSANCGAFMNPGSLEQYLADIEGGASQREACASVRLIAQTEK